MVANILCLFAVRICDTEQINLFIHHLNFKIMERYLVVADYLTTEVFSNFADAKKRFDVLCNIIKRYNIEIINESETLLEFKGIEDFTPSLRDMSEQFDTVRRYKIQKIPYLS